NDLGRLGRVNQTHSAGAPVKTGLLGRLGRLFETHLEGDQSKGDKKSPADHQLNECGKGVPGVLNAPAARFHRPLTGHEWAIMVRAGAENDPLIIEAVRLFNVRVVE